MFFFKKKKFKNKSVCDSSFCIVTVLLTVVPEHVFFRRTKKVTEKTFSRKKTLGDSRRKGGNFYMVSSLSNKTSFSV